MARADRRVPAGCAFIPDLARLITQLLPHLSEWQQTHKSGNSPSRVTSPHLPEWQQTHTMLCLSRAATDLQVISPHLAVQRRAQTAPRCPDPRRPPSQVAYIARQANAVLTHRFVGRVPA
eukprot:364516-Chlamydomonas_euryale.AAC.5